MSAPSVLGLSPEAAIERLNAAGFHEVIIRESGRRREGKPRVIRQKELDGGQELTVSWLKELAKPE
jgi:hypothetical protein